MTKTYLNCISQQSINSSNCNFESSVSVEGTSFLWYNFSTISENFKNHSSFLLIKFVAAIQDMQQTISYFNGLLSWSLEIILLNRIMQSCQKCDFSEANIPCVERKASVAVVNLTDDT